MKKKRNIWHMALLCALALCGEMLMGQTAFPGASWKAYANVEDAGYSAQGLEAVREQFEDSQGAALLVIHNGKVLLSHGNTTRRFMVHSVRKSFMHALYGAYASQKELGLDRTLESLGIDDTTPLTATEKKATLRDLMAARSGIYLPSAYSPRGMEDNLPARGSAAPGTQWFYNNWDFNVLSTIFEKHTGKKIFNEFDVKIAQPIGMEDFRPEMDGYYRLEQDKSMHPAYLFKMSARDMARFGLLYLNNGKWNDTQLLPAPWVTQAVEPVTRDLGSFNNKGSYGLLWWVSDGIDGEPMYYASGSGGHRIMVLPESDLVVVHRVNTYERKGVSEADIQTLLKKLLAAKTGKGSATPSVKPYSIGFQTPSEADVPQAVLDKYLGSYRHPSLGNMDIVTSEDGLQLKNSVGVFRLYVVDENRMIPEDIETPIELAATTEADKKYTIEPVFGSGRSLQKVIFYYAK